jgi:integrase
MASVVKLKPAGRSPYWFACFRAPDGRRLKKSTKLTSKSKALRMAIKWQEAADEAKARRLTEHRAREVISEIVQSVHGGKSIRWFTVRQWFEHFFKVKAKSSDPATAAKYEQIKREFLSFLGSKADFDLSSVTSDDARAFRDKREQTGVSATTLNDNLTILSAIFNGARKAHVIFDNPCLGIEAVTDTVTPARRRKQPFDVDQVKALLDHAEGDWHGLIKVAFYTGARLDNCANLRFGNLEFNSDPPVIVFEKYSKHGDEHKVPMHPALEDYLLSLPAPKSDSAFLFPSLAGRRVANLSKQFRKLMVAACIKNWKVREGVKGKGRGSARDVWALGFHSFRRTNVSIMADKGVPEERRMALAAHATREIHQSYTHLDLQRLHDAISVLPAL